MNSKQHVQISQFLSDVVTAAGLLEHGKQSKALAMRIADGAAAIRTELFQKGTAMTPAQVAHIMALVHKFSVANMQGNAVAAMEHCAAVEAALRDAPQQAEPIKYTPGEWFDATTVDLMEAFYRSRLPAIREAAKEHGYAIGVHGSMRRDLDLIAAPWRDGASDADTLVEAIQKAACGFTQSKYQWEKKPAGRVAISVPICWTHRHGVLSDGHIDLSVLGVVSGVRQCPTCDGDGWTEEGNPEIGSAKGDCPTCKSAGCLATPSAPTAVEPDERDDPLQGAVDWFLQADGEFFCVATVQRTLRIGYNRAKRLSEVAKERAAISAKKGGAA